MKWEVRMILLAFSKLKVILDVILLLLYWCIDLIFYVVCEARGLIEEVLIKRNPFCEVTFEGTKFFTSVVKNNLNPHWNEEFTL